jgi:hypothetical protein
MTTLASFDAAALGVMREEQELAGRTSFGLWATISSMVARVRRRRRPLTVRISISATEIFEDLFFEKDRLWESAGPRGDQ